MCAPSPTCVVGFFQMVPDAAFEFRFWCSRVAHSRLRKKAGSAVLGGASGSDFQGRAATSHAMPRCHASAAAQDIFLYLFFCVCVFLFSFFFVPWSWAAAFAWAQRTLEYDRSYSSPMLLQALGCKCSPIPLTLSAPTASPAIVIPQPPSPLQRHLPLPLSPLHVTLTRPLPRHPTTQSPCLPTFSVWAPHECVSQKFGSSGG